MLQEIVTGCASLGGPPELDAFRKHLPREWIEEALRATGTATLRRRRLPAEQVVWLVLGMALFKGRSITDVVDKLDLALPGSGRVTVAPSAIAQARARLGQEPVRWLFEQCANKWAHQSADGDRWRGLALYAVDGTSLRVPDSEANRHEFGLIVGRLAPEGSGYPVMRAVALMALRSHMLAAVAFGPCKHGEHTYARQLWG